MDKREAGSHTWSWRWTYIPTLEIMSLYRHARYTNRLSCTSQKLDLNENLYIQPCLRCKPAPECIERAHVNATGNAHSLSPWTYPIPTYLQKPFTITQHPGQAFRIVTRPSSMTFHASTPLAASPTTNSLYPQTFPSFQLPLKPQSFLPLFSQISFGASSSQLTLRFVGLQLIDLLKQTFDFLATFHYIFIQLCSNLVTTSKLGLQVADCTVNVAGRAKGCGGGGFLRFELVLQLRKY